MSLYHKSRQVLPHKASINAAAFGPNAAFLATVTADGGVYVWRVADGALICCAVGDTPALSLAWLELADNTFVYGTASGNVVNCSFSPVRISNTSVPLHHLTHTQAKNTLDLLGFLAHSAPVNCISAHEDFVVSGAGREAHVWQWRSDGTC